WIYSYARPVRRDSSMATRIAGSAALGRLRVGRGLVVLARGSPRLSLALSCFPAPASCERTPSRCRVRTRTLTSIRTHPSHHGQPCTAHSAQVARSSLLSIRLAGRVGSAALRRRVFGPRPHFGPVRAAAVAVVPARRAEALVRASSSEIW